MFHQVNAKKGNITVLILLAVAALAVAGVVWYAQSQSNENTNMVANTNGNVNTAANLNRNVATTNTNADSNTNTASGNPYANDDLGFQLAFPPEWNGYSVSTSEEAERTLVTFKHPQEESSQGLPGEVSFTIYVYESATATLPTGVHRITSGNGRLYAYSKSNAATPGELGTFWNQIDSIIDSFALR